MRKNYLVALLLCVTGALFIGGCAAAPQPTQSPLQQIGASSAAVSPIPTSTPVVSPVVLKVAKPGTATVGGRLLRLNKTPIKDTTVYAAAIDEATGTKLASIDPVIAPHAETGPNGQFSFSELAPGEYALVVSTPLGLILPETSGNKSVTFTAQADQVTDLGAVAIIYEY